jgi:hypothetical protein
VIALSVLVAAWLVYQSQELQQCICKEHEDYTHQPPKQRSPFLFFAFRNYGGCVWHWLDRNNGAVLALATIIIAFFTIRIFRDESANRKKELRAYVAIESAAMISFDDGAMLEAIVWIKNYGKTPAYKLTGYGGIAIGVSFETLVPPTTTPGATRATLPPGGKQKHFASYKEPLKAGTMDALRAGQLTLFVYGEFRFFDAFNIERFVEYRFQAGGVTGVRGNDLAICEEGNNEN